MLLVAATDDKHRKNIIIIRYELISNEYFNLQAEPKYKYLGKNEIIRNQIIINILSKMLAFNMSIKKNGR